MSRRSLSLAACLWLAGCAAADGDTVRHDTASFIAPAGQAADVFPVADRPVAAIVSARWSTETARDNAHEADAVIAALAVAKGMTVADIGAGEGYYEPHLARVVGPAGTVIAEDIVPETLAALARRVEAARLTNVLVARGEAHDPRLPPHSVDIALLIHMYHEVDAPFALLWNLRSALKPGGRVAVLDADRATGDHGTPPTLLACEFAAVGYARQSQRPIGVGVYLAIFAPQGPPPVPAAIKPCGQTPPA